MNPGDFWSPFETKIKNFTDLEKAIGRVSKKWSSATFAWRGQVSADWPLFSSLYRRLCLTRGPLKAADLPEEDELYLWETKILADVHRWGLHVSRDVGRLSILNQLAALQHHGAPTRLVDVTFNPWIAAWFAVEEKRDNGELVHEDNDARLFAIDVTNRLINENDRRRDWEDNLHRAWPGAAPKLKEKRDIWKRRRKPWCSEAFAWRPPHFDSRIAAQNGGFIFGGVPSTSGPSGQVQWPKSPNSGGNWRINEVRTATSLALRPHKLNAKRGGVTQNAVYSFRVLASAKREIRKRLEKTFGYEHKTIYPDFTGFALYGTPELKSRS